jgi:transposase
VELRTGAPWRDLPDRYGPWKTAHERLRLWTKDGTWDRIRDRVIVKDDAVGGLPIRFLLTPGQAGDNPQLVPLLDGISVARSGPGRPRCRPETVIADKAYSHPSTRQAMRHRRITFVSPERDDQIARRAAKGLARRATTRVRCRGLQAAQRGRAVLQPA